MLGRAVLPRGLDEDPARVAGAGLRDRALAQAFARLIERGHEPEEGGQLARASEAGEVADLKRDDERRERIEAAEAAQAGDRRRPRPLDGESREPLVEAR